MNIAVNGGLFNNAQRAVDDTNAKVSNTQDRVDELSGILDDVASRKDIHDWTRNGDNLRCKYCNLSLIIGDYLDYSPDSTSTAVIVSTTESGYETTQTFIQETGNYWKVLGIEDEDGNGTNETLLIKMVNPTETALTLYGAAAYNNGEIILNKICKELYSSNRYGEARSIKAEDVNNCLQYTPDGGMFENEDLTLSQTNGFNTQIKNLPTWETIKANGTYTPDGTNTEENLGLYKLNGYYYYMGSGYYLIHPITDARIPTTENALATAFCDANSYRICYWLATPFAYCQSDMVNFGLLKVWHSMVHFEKYDSTFSSDGSASAESGQVCPVVSLKKEIPPKISGPVIKVPIPM